MPRSGPNGTYTLPGAQATQQPGTPIPSAVNNQGYSDIEQTFNTVQPRAYGGTDSNDLKLNDANFGVRNNADATKIGVFNAAGLPTATTRTYDLPYYSGTLGLVSDIRGQIYGLTLSNGTDAVNDINIAAGAAVDASGVVSILLASGITKQLDAAWAVGTNAGMRATGAAIANATYHIFLIRRPDTGVVDIAADTSVTGANIAANTNVNYTQIRRIGSIIRKAGTILGFSQIGNYFQYTIAQSDVNVTNLGTAATSYTITTPTDIPVLAKIRVVTGNAAINVIKVSSLFESDTFDAATGDLSLQNPVAAINIAGEMEVLTSVASQIRGRSGAASTTFRVTTFGYTDTRAQY